MHAHAGIQLDSRFHGNDEDILTVLLWKERSEQ